MPSATRAFPDVPRFTRNDATRIAAQTSLPSSSMEAIAIPVPGHTAVALGFTNANASPSLQAMK